MKICVSYLLLLFLCFSFAKSYAQSEEIKKELRDADSKYLYGQKYEEAKAVYLKHAAYLIPQQQVYLANCFYADPARSKESYAKGMEWLNKAADRGNTEAMRSIAYCYQTGLGVKKDSVQQIAWTKKASDYGDPVAMVTLGYFYEAGWGVPNLKAIDKGSSEASYYLGMHERDKGNNTNALYYLEKAAGGRYAPAQFELGLMYEKGMHGVKKDADEAVRWFNRISNTDQNRQYANAAVLKIHEMGQTEPSTNLQTVKPLLLKLVSRANERFYDLKGKLITPYNKPMYDDLGSSKNEYYTVLLDVGFKNAYIRKHNFDQIQKNKSVKNVDNFIYNAEIIYSSSRDKSYSVYLQWADILKSIFPGWKLSQENFPDLKRGTTTLYQHHSNGRTTIITLKTCCPNDKVEFEIENRHNSQ
jgi:TPR repeat protein